MGIFGAGAVAAYLAACGGGDDSSSSEQSQSQGGQQSAAQATPLAGAQGEVTQFQQGTSGGKMTIGVTLETGTLDTAIPLSGRDTVFLATMYNPLLTIDHFVPNPELSLAQKYEVVDPTTLTFALRQGVKFHDGSDFNAEAVKYNMTRILDPATRSAARSSMLDLDRVEVVDPHTVSFILKQPNAAILNAGESRRSTVAAWPRPRRWKSGARSSRHIPSAPVRLSSTSGSRAAM
jgi:peptide/nickel transport system substrate-binding protein